MAYKNQNIFHMVRDIKSNFLAIWNVDINTAKLLE